MLNRLPVFLKNLPVSGPNPARARVFAVNLVVLAALAAAAFPVAIERSQIHGV